MKKITLLLVIIFTFLFSTTSWGEWTYVTKNVNGNGYYYDKDRVRKSGKYIYFWELVDFKKGISITTYVQLDCSIFRHKFLKRQIYEKFMGEEEMTSEWTPKDDWYYPKPKSVSEYMNNKICEEHQ